MRKSETPPPVAALNPIWRHWRIKSRLVMLKKYNLSLTSLKMKCLRMTFKHWKIKRVRELMVVMLNNRVWDLIFLLHISSSWVKIRYQKSASWVAWKCLKSYCVWVGWANQLLCHSQLELMLSLGWDNISYIVQLIPSIPLSHIDPVARLESFRALIIWFMGSAWII